jgi:hypothetical protein
LPLSQRYPAQFVETLPQSQGGIIREVDLLELDLENETEVGELG